jgi:hypothetical protein
MRSAAPSAQSKEVTVVTDEKAPILQAWLGGTLARLRCEERGFPVKSLWKILAWVFATCGLLAFFSAWGNLWFGWKLWAASPELLFYDAIAGGLFALFFLAWGKYGADSAHRL